MPINESTRTFIPKKSVIGEKRKAGNSSGIFFGVSLIIFLLSIVSAGVLYGYGAYLNKRVDSLGASLERAKSAFEPALIRELQQLDARMDSAEKVLSGHIAVSALFSALQNLTLKSIRFNRFSYTRTDKSIDIQLSGVAKSYSSIALQSDIFGDSNLSETLFSNLGLDREGNVTFNFSAKISQSLILYQNTL